MLKVQFLKLAQQKPDDAFNPNFALELAKIWQMP